MQNYIYGTFNAARTRAQQTFTYDNLCNTVDRLITTTSQAFTCDNAVQHGRDLIHFLCSEPIMAMGLGGGLTTNVITISANAPAPMAPTQALDMPDDMCFANWVSESQLTLAITGATLSSATIVGQTIYFVCMQASQAPGHHETKLGAFFSCPMTAGLAGAAFTVSAFVFYVNIGHCDSIVENLQWLSGFSLWALLPLSVVGATYPVCRLATPVIEHTVKYLFNNCRRCR